MPGVRRNYLASLRMARILEGIVPRRYSPLADCPAERREHAPSPGSPRSRRTSGSSRPACSV